MKNDKTAKSEHKISIRTRKIKNSEGEKTERLFAELATLAAISKIFYTSSSLSNDTEYSDAIAYAKQKKSSSKRDINSTN